MWWLCSVGVKARCILCDSGRRLVFLLRVAGLGMEVRCDSGRRLVFLL